MNRRKIEKGWSLFLDRDGVINTQIPDDYVISLEQFSFIPGVLDAFQILSGYFGRIVVVSNQQGIGKGLMTEAILQIIHTHMISEVEVAGGRIDKVYFCPELRESHSFMRKPNIGMGLLARKNFPDIRYTNSVMVGDSISDMRFGKRLGMLTVFISDDLNEIRSHASLIDQAFPDLYTFSESLFTR
ncbi:MAG TPA: HAD-IIIA family hydrolase [Bacteroidales bacterium]